MSLTKSYPREVDTVLGHAPGTIIKDEVTEYRVVRAASKVALHRYRKYGIEGIHNVMGLVDDCTVPSFFEGPAYQERYLGTLLMEEDLTNLARRHLGGGEGHTAQAFNRVTAGTITLMQALVPPGSLVPYFVPAYPGMRGHGHPSVPRAVEMAKASWEQVTTLQEMESLLDGDRPVPLVAVCPSYRGVLSEEDLQSICDAAHARGIPVYIDDASGARTRAAVFDQRPALQLGADIVVTSGEKAAFYGPRAAVMLGRADLMEHICAKANLMGSEARPSVVAALVQTLREYTPEHGHDLFNEWLERHRRMWELAKPFLGEALQYGAYDGIYLSLPDFMDLVMERAGTDETDLAPVDLSVACCMLMLRGYGFLTVPALHYPGASKLVSVKVNSLREGDSISDDEIVEALSSSVEVVARVVRDRPGLERVLFGPPE